MEDNNNNQTKAVMIKAAKIAVFAGLGYIAAGPLGALGGLILAMAK